MNPIELGKFIAKLRSDKELTQEELAEKLFIDKRKVSRWECGTSIPEFDMLIKLSEILDVSLYELSICQKITDEKLSKRILNRFKNIKDLKKYKTKRIILFILLILLLCFFITTTIYTFKNSNTIEIYKLDSLDEDYTIDGIFIKIKGNYIMNINKLFSTKTNINTCHYEIYDKDKRIINMMNTKNELKLESEKLQFYNEITELDINNKLSVKITCDNNAINEYSFDFKLIKIYDNGFF